MADSMTTRTFPSTSNRRHLIMGVVATSLTLLMIVGAAETCLRVFWDRPVDCRRGTFEFWKYMHLDPELGYIPRPNIRVEYPRHHAFFTTNSQGLRGETHPVVRRPGLHRVVVLGDSFAWGHGVSQGEAFPERLERRIAHCDVINLGVPGFNLRTELRYYQRIGMQYQPDVVLLALCQNDIRCHEVAKHPRITAAVKRRARTESMSIVRHSELLHSFKQLLSDHSFLYAYVQQTVNTVKPLARAAVAIGLKDEMAGFEMLDDNLHAALVNDPPSVQLAMKQLEDDLLRINTVVRKQGARLIVALIPSLQSVDHNALIRSIAYTRYEAVDFDLDKPYRAIERFAARHDIPLINPMARFRKEFNGGKTLYLPQDLHFNSAGHDLFAEAIRPELTEMLNHPPAGANSR